MRAGRLDRRIVLLRPTATRNGLNEKVVEWAPIAGMPPQGVAARREPIGDSERVRAQQIGAAITDRFTIRWASAYADLEITGPSYELEYSGRRYGIHAVKELGRREGFEITATGTPEAEA